MIAMKTPVSSRAHQKSRGVRTISCLGCGKSYPDQKESVVIDCIKRGGHVLCPSCSVKDDGRFDILLSVTIFPIFGKQLGFNPSEVLR